MKSKLYGLGFATFTTSVLVLGSFGLNGCVDYCASRYNQCMAEASAHASQHQGQNGLTPTETNNCNNGAGCEAWHSPCDNAIDDYFHAVDFFRDCMERNGCGDWQPGDSNGSPTFPDGSGSEGLV